MRPSRPDPDFPFFPKKPDRLSGTATVNHQLWFQTGSGYRKDTFEEENAHYVIQIHFFHFFTSKRKCLKEAVTSLHFWPVKLQLRFKLQPNSPS